MTPPRDILISRDDFDAVIFDLDGVLTRTAELHAEAWKEIFDAYLEELSEREGHRHPPFDIATDYPRHVDGKPRYDGVRDFLAARGIELPEGTPDSPAEEESVCGLGNRKDRHFNRLLEQRGGRTFPAAVALVRQLQTAGLATAVISASKNARRVLAAAGLAELFPVRVDGIEAEREGLRGKPHPDVFLAAARKLGAEPERSVVVEDALAGVEAGRAGGFGLVIGVDRSGQSEELARWADVVVEDLARICVPGQRSTADLPSALDRMEEIAERLRDRTPAVFLDYDGTLTPIVPRPEDARLGDRMRQTVRLLAALCPVAVVSGRDLQDVRQLVSLGEIVYAGSHGFDIAGPAGRRLEFQQGTDFLPALDRAESSLREKLGGIEGCQVERKKFAVAVHFRRVAQERHGEIEDAVEAVRAETEGLRRTGGKMIFELRPDLDWDKGRALFWLLERLGLDRDDVVPLYLGDDLTDEDALRVLRERGIGILVRDEVRPTTAAYALEEPAEVETFLRRLAGVLAERSP